MHDAHRTKAHQSSRCIEATMRRAPATYSRRSWDEPLDARHEDARRADGAQIADGLIDACRRHDGVHRDMLPAIQHVDHGRSTESRENPPNVGEQSTWDIGHDVP